jgi:hypothetical protein
MARFQGARMEGRSNYGRGILQPPAGWTRQYRPDGSFVDAKRPGRISDLAPELRPTGRLTTLAEARAALSRRSLRGT